MNPKIQEYLITRINNKSTGTSGLTYEEVELRINKRNIFGVKVKVANGVLNRIDLPSDFTFEKLNVKAINFSGCKTIKKVTRGAFIGFDNVTEIDFGERVTEVGEKSLSDMNKLKNVYVNNNVDMKGVFSSDKMIERVVKTPFKSMSE